MGFGWIRQDDNKNDRKGAFAPFPTLSGTPTHRGYRVRAILSHSLRNHSWLRVLFCCPESFTHTSYQCDTIEVRTLSAFYYTELYLLYKGEVDPQAQSRFRCPINSTEPCWSNLTLFHEWKDHYSQSFINSLWPLILSFRFSAVFATVAWS